MYSRRGSRSATRSAGSDAFRGLLLRKAVEPAVGHHRSTDSLPRRTWARRSTFHCIPHSLCEAGAELLILVVLLLTESGEAVRRTDVLALHPALRHLALRSSEMFRGDPRGTVFIFSTSAVHLHPSRTARGHHARVSRPWRSTDTEDRSHNWRPDTSGLAMAQHTFSVPEVQRRRPTGSVSGLDSAQPVAIVGPAADQGRPRADLRTASQAESTGQGRSAGFARDSGPCRESPSPKSWRCRFSIKTATLRWSTNPQVWSSIRQQAMPRGTLSQRPSAPPQRSQRHWRRKRPGIVHRLDRGTSGLMVVAKHDAAMKTGPPISRARGRKRNTSRWCGERCRQAVESTQPIGRDPGEPEKMSARARRSREAVTEIHSRRALESGVDARSV